LVRAFESHDIAGAAEFEPFIGDGEAGDVAAQLLQFFSLIHGAAHLGMRLKPCSLTQRFWVCCASTLVTDCRLQCAMAVSVSVSAK
jgi:hypothetical protein